MWRFPASFYGNDGTAKAVAGRGVLSCICLAPQLVCGCSTRAPLAFFLSTRRGSLGSAAVSLPGLGGRNVGQNLATAYERQHTNL